MYFYKSELYINLLIISFHLYIYPPDSQESDEGAIHKASNYLYLLLEMLKYCCLVKI